MKKYDRRKRCRNRLNVSNEPLPTKALRSMNSSSKSSSEAKKSRGAGKSCTQRANFVQTAAS